MTSDTRRAGKRRALRIAAGAAATVVLLAVALAAHGFWTVLTPQSATPVKADAVVVFYGDSARMREALRLMRNGVAPVLVIESPLGTEPGLVENPPGTSVGTPSFSVVRFAVQGSTQDEARRFAAIAHERSWSTIVAVTSDFHLARAELLLDRCYRGRIVPVGVVPDAGRRQTVLGVVHEVLGLVAARIAVRGC